MYEEDDLLPLSALQHLLFCPRQCALIHLDGVWAENRLTVEGKQLHDRVHEQGAEHRADLHVARGVAIRSFRLGLSGKADVVEFHRIAADASSAGPSSQEAVSLSGRSGLWRPFLVEYKRGKPKSDHSDSVQLCAQAMCLEEMLGVPVPEGALFYGTTRRRFAVSFDPALRQKTEETARALHRLFDTRALPPAILLPKCENCSLAGTCLPQAAPSRSALRYLRNAVTAALKGTSGSDSA